MKNPKRPKRESPDRLPLAAQIRALPPREAAALVERAVPAEAVEALLKLNPALAGQILRELDPAPRRFLTASAPPAVAEQWKRNMGYAEGTIGRLMEAGATALVCLDSSRALSRAVRWITRQIPVFDAGDDRDLDQILASALAQPQADGETLGEPASGVAI